jgi:Zn-dependent peptidase ImmA (M78 family)
VNIARAEEAARALHARFGVAKPWDLDVELTAAELGGYVVYGDVDGGSDARVTRVDGVAYICIARAQRGTPRARFSMAHEMAHLDLHPDVDALARIHGLPRAKRREFAVEQEADAFASEWLMPRALFAEYCGAVRPTLDDVARAARTFRTSLSATAKRWTALAPPHTACAFVEYKNGRVRHFDRSAAFRAHVVKRRPMSDRAWTEALIADGVEIAEESVRVPGTDVVLSWVWHDATQE